MASNPHYNDSYPRSGQVALLCEGDVVGYEVSILKRWLDQHLGVNPLVDIWPCGTVAAIFGICDSIGRSRPIVVVEDRDYRSREEADKQVKEKHKDRTSRGITMLAWRAWWRNEIENYLIEPDVVVPCFSKVFDCSTEEVKQILAGVLPALAVHQAFQSVFYNVRQKWYATDPAPQLPNMLVLSPIWNDSTLQASTPDFDLALKQFQQNLERWTGRIASHVETEELLVEIKRRFEKWRNPKLEDQFWRLDWAGKDILQWLRIALAARFGWRDRKTGNRVKQVWAGLNRSRRDAQDRPIESELKPVLVRSFLEFLSSQKTGELFDEWQDLISSFSNLQGKA